MRVYYVDTANTVESKKRSRKTHTVYDGEKIFNVRKLTELKMLQSYILIHCFHQSMRKSMKC